MSTSTLGSNSTTSLTSLVFQTAGGGQLSSDFAAISNLIQDDLQSVQGGTPHRRTYFSKQGILFVPRRGQLKVFPGDYVAVDPTTGWPVLISAQSIAAGPWTHT